ncbi:cadherin-related family member 5 isoform X1 [Gadus macrocephalus]|uniref:cadherin-related family member 5 isoform X1 n=1 Tax=Gadus macrocephalus TaxID=80720 RepID=UPI0028CB315C|nr:cadherin-related family member 5 isoform X1 [Gadus macrocephalus]
MLSPWRLLLWELAVKLPYHIITASLCLGGSDIFATVRENSPMGQFISNLSISGEAGPNAIRMCLSGKNADWLFLDGKAIRLNSSLTKVLDREVQGAILLAELICYEDNIMQSYYRVIVEILNENDNLPQFVEKTIQPIFISELAAVNSVVFSVKATDADEDVLLYMIDKASPDASFFRIDLPNSGNVLLDKPLDYESKTQLQLVIYAMEMNTRDGYNTTATLTVHIKDGDDQYPQFLPCNPPPANIHLPVCTNPIYMANITQADQDIVLGFSPGPIHAVDGDRGLKTRLTFTLLSGADNGRFAINNETGEVKLTRRVEDKQLTPIFRLRIMASQLNDDRKYSVVSAQVRVLAENSFPPTLNQTTYKGFVIQSDSPATIVSTYGKQVLIVQATDRDFADGFNPKIEYTLHPLSASEGLFYITREGIVIVRTRRLKAFDRHILEVVAKDEESGERATASLDIEVLQRGQSVPRGQFQEEPLFGDVDTTMAGAISAILLVLFVTVICLTVHLVRRRRDRQDPVDQGALTMGEDPNVSLLSFKRVNPSRAAHCSADLSFMAMSFSSEEGESARAESLRGRAGVYTRKTSLLPLPMVHLPEDQEDSPETPPPKSGLFQTKPKGCTAPSSSTSSSAAPTKVPLKHVSKTLRKDQEEEDPPPAPWRTEGRPATDDSQTEYRRAGPRKLSLLLPLEEAASGSKPPGKGAPEQRIENPYSAMHAVICVSDNEEDDEDTSA